MKAIVKKGATSVILEVFIQDSSSSTGAGLTGLAHNSAGLTCYYHRNTASSTSAVTLVTMTVGTFTSSGFKEVDATNMPGVYQLCLPNAAFASGADSVSVLLKGATNMAPLVLEVQLRPAPADVQSWLETAVTLSATTNKPEVDVSSISDDATAADNLEAAYDGTGYGDGTAQAGGSTSITLAAGASSVTDFYAGSLVVILGGTGAGQGARLITGYNGTTKVATVTPAWATNPDNTSTYAILPWGFVGGLAAAAVDNILTRDMSAVDDSVSRSPLQALRFLRNGFDTASTPGTVKAFKEDGTTVAWTLTLSTNSSADPITGAS